MVSAGAQGTPTSGSTSGPEDAPAPVGPEPILPPPLLLSIIRTPKGPLDLSHP